MRPRSFRNLQRHLMRDAKSLHQLQLTKIKRADIAAVLNAASRDCGGPTANRVRTSLMSFFGWAVEQSLVETNPVIGTGVNEDKKPATECCCRPNFARYGPPSPTTHDGAIVKPLGFTGYSARMKSRVRYAGLEFTATRLCCRKTARRTAARMSCRCHRPRSLSLRSRHSAPTATALHAT